METKLRLVLNKRKRDQVETLSEKAKKLISPNKMQAPMTNASEHILNKHGFQLHIGVLAWPNWSTKFEVPSLCSHKDLLT